MSPITQRRPPDREARELALGTETRRVPPLRREARAAAPPCLDVQRTAIRFHDVAEDHVRIEVDVENRGGAHSAPTVLRLESAPFGAFVRWRELATLPVPAIAPGAKATVVLETPRPRPRARTGFDGFTPRDLATASGFAPDPRRPAGFLDALLGFLGKKSATSSGLDDDPFDVLGRSQPHWAGNVNVWVGEVPVERHMAPRLRVHPGRANVAAFCVGDRRERFAFRVERPGDDWQVELANLRRGTPVEWTARPWEEPRWLELEGRTYLLCAVRPPFDCGAGALEVHVTQRSSGRVAVVELDLDPCAAGPGCFVG